MSQKLLSNCTATFLFTILLSGRSASYLLFCPQYCFGFLKLNKNHKQTSTVFTGCCLVFIWFQHRIKFYSIIMFNSTPITNKKKLHSVGNGVQIQLGSLRFYQSTNPLCIKSLRSFCMDLGWSVCKPLSNWNIPYWLQQEVWLLQWSCLWPCQWQVPLSSRVQRSQGMKMCNKYY